MLSIFSFFFQRQKRTKFKFIVNMRRFCASTLVSLRSLAELAAAQINLPQHKTKRRPWSRIQSTLNCILVFFFPSKANILRDAFCMFFASNWSKLRFCCARKLNFCVTRSWKTMFDLTLALGKAQKCISTSNPSPNNYQHERTTRTTIFNARIDGSGTMSRLSVVNYFARNLWFVSYRARTSHARCRLFQFPFPWH